ncbi:hypothetical protein GCM10019016_011120 [Streptomyces prasinosporus]|uniref:Uncharacterized protein n=1 Tax=Streptomyces prasinosporus TaxID=68256 RepID=A0ABP6TFM8_9ACTN
MGLDASSPGAGPVAVQRGVPAGAERRAAELYWDAFGRKLGPALNPADKAVPFIAALVRGGARSDRHRSLAQLGSPRVGPQPSHREQVGPPPAGNAYAGSRLVGLRVLIHTWST